ncbi:putative ring finger protein [Hibiscus syriacus]|uniref:Ring finger protein n=1 Tax=Hibiscus syriacus TaxID=106335 RepID=A0A6A2XJ22_HIBSY|nr:putative ring finger protein [Hibiscus syriacus]
MELLSSWCYKGSLPDSYVMPPETRPGDLIVPLGESIPVIDLQCRDRNETVRQILKASEDYGFFQVINHGVSEYLMDETMEVAEEFHAMPGSDKEKECAKDPKGSCKLYTSSYVYPREEFHLWRDAVTHPCRPSAEHIQFWPEKPTRYRKVVGAYSVELWKLSCRILEFICQGLGLSTDYLSNELSQDPKIMINHYPPCPEPSLTLGLFKHRDPTIITILLQGQVHGLQVFKDGRWICVEPIPHAFVVNIGYLLQIISNGKLMGAEHRVVTNSRDPRTTISFFVYPCDESLIGPAKALVDARNPAIYKAFKFTDFVATFILKPDKEALKELISAPLAPFQLRWRKAHPRGRALPELMLSWLPRVECASPGTRLHWVLLIQIPRWGGGGVVGGKLDGHLRHLMKGASPGMRLSHVATESAISREGASPGMRLPHVAANSALTRVKRVPGDASFATSAERCSILSGMDNVIHVMIEDDQAVRKASKNGEDNKIIRIAENEVSWRQSCLVGKIKNMYNEDIVQTSFSADGFNVKVSIWHELLVVIQFKYESARQVCWLNREHWVSRWFDELELLEGYENKHRVKTWILLSDVPLLVWSESFFMKLGSLWGKMLLVEDDTCNRSRFDVARILLEVHYASDIPEKVSIVCNGRLYSIKITIEAQEESRMFIDGLMPGGGACCLDVVVTSKENLIEDVHTTGGLGEAEVERRVVVDEALHKVSIFVNDGPKDLFVDDSFGYMELNRDVGHVWKTQSISNSSRLLDILIDEVSSFRRDSEGPNSYYRRRISVPSSSKHIQDHSNSQENITFSVEKGTNGVEINTRSISIVPRRKKKSSTRRKLLQIARRGTVDQANSAREIIVGSEGLQNEAEATFSVGEALVLYSQLRNRRSSTD